MKRSTMVTVPTVGVLALSFAACGEEEVRCIDNRTNTVVSLAQCDQSFNSAENNPNFDDSDGGGFLYYYGGSGGGRGSHVSGGKAVRASDVNANVARGAPKGGFGSTAKGGTVASGRGSSSAGG